MSGPSRPTHLGRIALKRRTVANVAKAPSNRQEALVALSEQAGVPALDLEQICIPVEALRLVPGPLAHRLQLLPCLVQGERLFVAMANPSDRAAVAEVATLTRLRLFAYAALSEELTAAIEEAYAAERKGETHYIGAQCPLSTLRKAGLEPTPVSGPGGGAAAEPPVGSAEGTAAPDPSGGWLAHALSAPPPPPVSSLPPALRGSFAPPDGPLTGSVTDFSPSLEELMRDLRVKGANYSLPAEPGLVDPSTPPSLSRGALPRTAPGPAAPDSVSSSDQPSSKSARAATEVLVVDDDAAVRTWVARALAQVGCTVTCAATGRQALEVLRHRRPRVLVLDLRLPDLHGFDLARRLHVSQHPAPIPVVVISGVYRGWRFAEDLKTTCGVAAYLEKPVSFEQLTRAVGEALQGTSQGSAPVRPLAARAEETLRLSLTASRAGRVEEAIAHLERGLSLDPLAAALHFHLGALYSKVGRVFEGIAALENGLELNSTDFSAVRNLALLYSHAGFRNRAAELWERGLRLAPDEPTRSAIKEHLIHLLS